MIRYKEKQSNKNLENVLDALEDLNHPVSTAQLKDHLSKKLNTPPVHVRTLQRWLKVLVDEGFVERRFNKYQLSSSGKRAAQFMQFSKGYGNMALNLLMNSIFPTTNTLSENLTNLINIFGVYVIYSLTEAVRLITTNRSGKEDHWHSSFFNDPLNFDSKGKFKERNLINDWIKSVFDPMYMLNLFVTVVHNSRPDGEQTLDNKKTKKNEDNVSDRVIKKEGIYIISGNNLKNKENKNICSLPLTVIDLIFKQYLYNNEFDSTGRYEEVVQNKALYDLLVRKFGHYGEQNLLYEASIEDIERIKNVLRSSHPGILNRLQEADEFFYSR